MNHPVDQNSRAPRPPASVRHAEAPIAVSGSTALWSGIVFSFLFTALIWFAGHWLSHGALTPDRPGFWYEWQLVEPSFWTRATAWGGYLLHQVTLWGLIWYAQQVRPTYSRSLHGFNVLALCANAFFITLHFAQTWFWFDGLAQDVHEATAQWSVIIVLIGVLVMENQRRGIVFGYRSGFMTEAGQVVRRYHGYYFAWAIVYTFWYHPMVNTGGHLVGFFYMFLLLLQGSLFFTRMHVNRYWTIVLELSVVAHGVLVAWFQAHAWQMFLTGFLGIFVLTQMHGLGLSRAWRWVIGIAYIGLVAAVYGPHGFSRVFEIALIPATELGGAVVLSLLVLGGMRGVRWWRAGPVYEEKV